MVGRLGCEQGDQLAEHAGGGAPDLVLAVAVEGYLARRALQVPDLLSERRRVQQQWQRDFDDLGDLGWRWAEVGPPRRVGDERRDQVVADPDPLRLESAPDLEAGGVDRQLLLGRTRCGVGSSRSSRPRR